MNQPTKSTLIANKLAEEEVDDENPYSKSSLRDYENEEYDIFDPYSKVIYFSTHIKVYKDIIGDTTFKKRIKNTKFQPVDLMSSKFMLGFWDEKNLPKPPQYGNPVVQDIFMAQNIARTHPKLFCNKVS